MERKEPKFGADFDHVQFRPRGHPSARPPQGNSDGLSWKIGIGVFAGVLGALLAYNLIERYQARRDAEEALRLLNQETASLEREIAASIPAPRPAMSARPRISPVPPGYRCAAGTLLYREPNGWTQITERSRHMYCPPGGQQSGCYQVTPRSVGCTR